MVLNSLLTILSAKEYDLILRGNKIDLLFKYIIKYCLFHPLDSKIEVVIFKYD